MVYEEEPLISIIVPVYNAEKYIERCIISLQNQIYSNIQIIIIDDGSLDDSLIICKNRALNDPRVLVIHQENRGVSAARNLGMSIAKGELIAFCDSDDVYKPELLSTLFDNLNRFEADLSVCGYLRSKTIDDTCFLKDSELSEVNVLGRQKAIEKIITESDGYIWNKLFKKSIIGNKCFSEEIAVLEDELFLLQYVSECANIVFTEALLYVYWDNPQSVVNNKVITSRKLTDILARERILDFLKSVSVNDKVAEIVWNDLMKSYSISYKKLLFTHENELVFWKKYILEGFRQRIDEYTLNNTWSMKEKAYYGMVKIMSTIV